MRCDFFKNKAQMPNYFCPFHPTYRCWVIARNVVLFLLILHLHFLLYCSLALSSIMLCAAVRCLSTRLKCDMGVWMFGFVYANNVSMQWNDHSQIAIVKQSSSTITRAKLHFFVRFVLFQQFLAFVPLRLHLHSCWREHILHTMRDSLCFIQFLSTFFLLLNF